MQSKPACRLAAALLCGAAVAALSAQTVLSQLGLEEPQARKALLTSVSTGSVYMGSAARRAFKAAPAATQKALVEGAIAWAKAHTTTADFKRAYAAQRDAARPKAPDPSQSGMPDAGGQQAQIEQMKKTAASMPPEQRQAMEEAIKTMEAMQKDPQMRKLQEQGAVMARQAADERHQRDIARWNENFPEDPNVLIARRLRSFLDVSGGVDFSAKLVPSGTGMKFADPKYEAKPNEWKMCYRAGPDAVGAARSAAAAWLKEIAPM